MMSTRGFSMFRCSRRTVWASAVAAVLTICAGSAPASSLADSGTLVTGHPDLIVAQAISSKQVLACFDQILATPFTFTDSNFYLQGYTEGRKTGGATGLTLSSATSSGGGFCLVALYTGSGDVRTYSRLVILSGAVTSMVPGGGGAGNVQGAVPILGSAFPSGPGGVLRPQLTAATPGAAGVVYSFDEPLTAAAGPAKFGFYTSGDSTFHAGTVIAFSPGMLVSVGFSPADLALLGQATRFVVGEGAVADAGGQTNPIGTIGGATKLLDLTSTTGQLAASGGLTYHFDFNAAIPGAAVACPGAFELYDVGGVRYSPAGGAPVTISADRHSVTLTFVADTVGGDAAQISLATVAADGIDASACGGTSLNSDGAAGLPGVSAKAPSTSGPDLTGFTINKTTGFASFMFDAPVAGIVPANFHLVSQSGALTAPPSQAISCLLSNGPAPVFGVGPANQVNVNFSTPTCLLLNLLLPGPADVTAARNAVGVTVDEGAVTDAATGVVNPVGSLGLVGATTGPTGPTGPTTPPAPTIPPGATTPTTPKPAVPKTCKRVVTLHLLTSISRNIRSVTATINGKKATVSKSRSLTVTFAKYPGVKSIVVKIKGKLKNGRSFSQTRRYTNKC